MDDEKPPLAGCRVHSPRALLAPSAILVGETTYLYYTETLPGSPGRIYLQHSTDGLHFAPANNGTSVWDRNNVDVKYDRGSSRAA